MSIGLALNELNRDSAKITSEYPLKVLQFGGGNFLRAFADWMIDILNEQAAFNGGVLLVKPTEQGDYQHLKAQQGLFHVLLEGIKHGNFTSEIRLVTCIQQVIHAYHEWPQFLKSAEIPSIRFILSNTTEAGIAFDPSDQKHDDSPHEFPAKLTRWLHHRYQYYQGGIDKGCIFLPCELIEANGWQLQQCILKYARHWEYEAGFELWIKQHNHFCNTLVDRIVSGYPKEQASSWHEELGFQDHLLVAAEHYHNWVIEGPEKALKELPFAQTDLKVHFVEDLTPYRTLKVRVLNGAHTAMVPIAYLSGLRTVSEATEHKEVSDFIIALLFKEVLPTLDLPADQVKSFIEDVWDRFRNPTIQHQLLSIALNSTTKFKTRIWPTMQDLYQQTAHLPARMVLSLAALIKFYSGSWQGQHISLQDKPQTLSFLRQQWQQHEGQKITLPQLTNQVLSKAEIWGVDLTCLPGLEKGVANGLKIIEEFGLPGALNQIGKYLEVED